jgi:hypothetical protein
MAHLEARPMTDKDIFDLADNYADWDDFGRWVFRDSDKLLQFAEELLSLETKPETSIVSEKREWVLLKDEDMTELDEDGVLFARYIEAKLKEKNT